MFVEAVAITTGKIIQLQLTDSVSDLSCLFWVDGMFFGPGARWVDDSAPSVSDDPAE